VDRSQKERAKTISSSEDLRHADAAQNRGSRGPRRFPRGLRARLAAFKKKDAEALLVTATAWSCGSSPVRFPGGLGRISQVAMMDRVRALDPKSAKAAWTFLRHLLHGAARSAAPRPGRGAAALRRSVKIAGADYCSTVTFAEYYARYAFDRDLFESTLKQVLAAQPDVPEFTLMNAVAKMRAKRSWRKRTNVL
jgi:hypothetical protein